MNYLSVFDNVSGDRLCFLENAYNVGYTLTLNLVHQATFTLPLDDPKNKYCQVYRYVEFWDSDKYVGLFRILPTVTTKSVDTREVVYSCEHVLATLMDDVLYGWHQIGNLGVYTNEVIQYVLNQQRTKRWQLNQCDFRRQFLYGWENENLLSALFSIATPFVDPYKWEVDTKTTPWTLSLSNISKEPVAEVRYKKNVTGITKTVDPTDLATRLIPLGYGEGVNQLTIASVNSGNVALEADTVDKYGEITRIWVDRRYQDADSLVSAAESLLEELKEPYTSYDVSTVYFGSLASANIGDYVRVIDDEDGTDFVTQIIQIDKPDVLMDPANATVTLANRQKNVAVSLADMADRERIDEVYAQGAVTVYTRSFADNCSPDYPAIMRFPVPSNVVYINEITLSGGPEAFRGYTTTIESTEQEITTTSDNGGEIITSTAGGGSSETSSEVELTPKNTSVSDDGGSGAANHNHGLNRGDHFAIVDNNLNIIGMSNGFSPSGAHTHGEHSHTVKIPKHYHDIDIPDHNHSITIPGHTHQYQHGIYTGPTASRLTILVDGNTVGIWQNLDNVNLVPYLSKNSDGTITRGWHTVEVVPNGLTRVELDMMIQLFANSRGGGQY